MLLCHIVSTEPLLVWSKLTHFFQNLRKMASACWLFVLCESQADRVLCRSTLETMIGKCCWFDLCLVNRVAIVKNILQHWVKHDKGFVCTECAVHPDGVGVKGPINAMWTKCISLFSLLVHRWMQSTEPGDMWYQPCAHSSHGGPTGQTSPLQVTDTGWLHLWLYLTIFQWQWYVSWNNNSSWVIFQLFINYPIYFLHSMWASRATKSILMG